MISLGLTVATSATGAAIQKKISGTGTKAVIISYEEKEDIMKIVKSLEKSGLLIKVASKTIENQSKEPKWEFLRMLFGTECAVLLGNMSARKM